MSSISGNIHGFEDCNPTVFTVAKDYIQSPSGFQSLVLNPGLKAFSWLKWYGYPLSSTMASVDLVFKRVSTLLDWSSFPTDIIKSLESGFEVADTAFLGSLADLPNKIVSAYLNFLSVIGLTADSVELGGKAGVIALSDVHQRILSAVGVMGSVALFIRSTKGLYEQAQILRTEEFGNPKHNLAMIRAASKVLLLAISCLGIAAFASVAVVAKVVLLSLSTLLLFLSIIAHFYEKIHRLDGEKPVAK